MECGACREILFKIKIRTQQQREWKQQKFVFLGRPNFPSTKYLVTHMRVQRENSGDAVHWRRFATANTIV